MVKSSVLHLMNGFKNASIGQIVKRLVQSLGCQNYQFFIGGLSNRGEMHDDYRQLGAAVIDFSLLDSGTLNSIAQIRQFLGEHCIQIIHTHTIRTLLVAWMAMIGLPAASDQRIIHISTKHILTTPKDRRWGAAYSLIDRISLYLPDYLVPVSHTMGRKILAQPWIDPRRVLPIPNAIPCEEWRQPQKRWETRRQYGIAPEDILIGFGGRFEPQKRLDLLLEAFSSVLSICPDAHLILAGDGSLRTQLESQAFQLNISNAVTWAGFCWDMPGFLAAIDIYIQPSVNEGLPLSVLEAMAAQKAVIATRVGGSSEVISDGKDGLLIPPLSRDAIQTALLDLIQHPDKRSSLAQNARTKVQSEYSLERMTGSYQKLYESVLR